MITSERPWKPEDRHTGLVRPVAHQPLVDRKRGDVGAAQVRRPVLEQRLPHRLDDEDLLLRAIGAPGGPLHRLHDHRDKCHGSPGQPREPGPETISGDGPHEELDEHHQHRRQVAPPGDQSPRPVRQQRRGQPGDERERRRDQIQPEIGRQLTDAFCHAGKCGREDLPAPAARRAGIRTTAPTSCSADASIPGRPPEPRCSVPTNRAADSGRANRRP